MMRMMCSLGSLSALFRSPGIPEGVEAVKGFDVQRYLGTWHEIARLDHRFERGLITVSATYSLNDDGSLRVINRGFDPDKNKWKEAKGRGRFVAGPDLGRLKVSFFGPFYGGYNIIELDKKEYSYALVCGNTRSYLWILARDRGLPRESLAFLVQKAKSLGFNADALIYVKQERRPGGHM